MTHVTNVALSYAESIIVLNAIKLAADKIGKYDRTVLTAIQGATSGLGAGTTLQAHADNTAVAPYESMGTDRATLDLNNTLYTNHDPDTRDDTVQTDLIYGHRMLKEWLELQNEFCRAVQSTTTSTAISQFLDDFLTTWRQRVPELFLDLVGQSRGRVTTLSAANVYHDGSTFELVKNRLATLTASAGPVLTGSNLTGSAASLSSRFHLKTRVHTAAISGGDMVISVEGLYKAATYDQVDLTVPDASVVDAQVEHLITTTDAAVAISDQLIPVVSTTNFNVGQYVLIRGTETASGSSLEIQTWGIIESIDAGVSITLTFATKCLYAFDAGAEVIPMYLGIRRIQAGGANAATAGVADIYTGEDRSLVW